MKAITVVNVKHQIYTQ